MKKLLNFRPALFLALLTGAAIVSAYFFACENIFGGVLFIAVPFAIAFVCSFIYGGKYIKRNLIFILIAAVVSTVAFSAFTVRYEGYKNADLGGVYCSISGRVKEVKGIMDDSVNLIVDELVFSGKASGRTSYKLSLYVSGASDVDVGDIVSFSAAVSDNGSFYEGRFMAERLSDGVKYSAKINSEDLEITGNHTTILESANYFIRNSLKSGLDDKTFQVGYALLCGNSDYVHGEVFSSYRSAGVAHIFAVSGLHIGFIAAAISLLLKKSKINPVIKSLIIIAALFFYSGICGFSASSLRAAIMYGVLLLAGCFGERYDGLSSISISFIIILLLNPVQLFCAGFILSFTVVFGITLLSKPIEKLLRFLPKKIASSLGVVLSAQIFSVPASILIFGEFSLIAVAVNLILVPIVGIVFVLLILCTVIGGVFSVSAVSLFIPKYLLFGIDYAINALDYSVFIVGGLTVGCFAAFYYLSLIVASGLCNVKGVFKTILSVLFAATFIAGTTVLTVKENSTSKIYVLGSESFCTTVIDDTENVMVVSYYKRGFSLSRLKSLKEKRNLENLDKIYLLNGDYETDVNLLITRLNAIFTVKEVYYCKERDETEIAVLEKSFKRIKFFACGDKGESLLDENYEYIENGYAIRVKIKDKKATVFSKLGNVYADIDRVEEDAFLTVAYDYLDRISSFYKSSEFISYRTNSYLKDAESNGTVALKIV